VDATDRALQFAQRYGRNGASLGASLPTIRSMYGTDIALRCTASINTRR